MRGVIKWAVGHPTIVNLLMTGLCLIGLLFMDRIPKQIFPDTALDLIVVQIVQRGAGPQELEKGALLLIEESLQGVSGIDRMYAEARENVGTMRLEIESGVDTTKVLRDVKDKVEQINNFPTDAERPQVFEIARRAQVISLVLHGQLTQGQLQKLGQRVKDEILTKSLISLVNVQGNKEREISIDVNEASLRRYGMSVNEVGVALRKANLDLSGGTIKTKREDFVLRAYGKRYLARDLENIVVRTQAGGNHIRIRDIGTARETFSETPSQFTFNGQPALLIQILRTPSQNALKIVKQVHAYVKEAKKTLPPKAKISIYDDRTVALNERISMLMKNGLQGLVLVLLTLSLLMNIRLSFWVAAGLPISMLGTFIIMSFTSVTINMLSLFGMLLVIGVLVDDAIVVGENVYAHYENGMPPHKAAVQGAVEVLPAVFASVTTTMLAFTPLFFMGGIVGKFIFVIPAVVIAALSISLVESLIILPPHLAHTLKPQTSGEHKQNRLRQFLDNAFIWFSRRFYAKILGFLLRHRWPVLGAGCALLLCSFGLIGGGFVKFVFFPRIDGDRIVVRFVMKPGTPVTETQKVLQRLQKAALEVNQELQKKYDQKVIINRATWLGRYTRTGPGPAPPTGAEVGEVQLELIRGEKRKLSSYKVIDQWRAKVGYIPGTLLLAFDSLGTPPLGRALEMNLLSNNQKQLQQAALFLKKKLNSFSGVTDPEDDLTLGKRELRLALTNLAKSMGISLQDVASQIRFRIYGQEVMRLQRGRDEVRVFVRYPKSDRNSLNQLDNITIRTRTGENVRLSQLVTWKTTRDLQIIRRIDRKRMATVYANLDDTKTTRGDVVRELRKSALPELAKVAPGVKVSFEGQGREQARVFGGMKVAFPIAMFGILAILVAVFQSYNQAFIIMLMIPFGTIGAILGHLIMGVPLTILSFFGIVGLSGMVVNDSLVLMDTINRHLRRGYNVMDAAWEAGQRRLRAIVSTTLTTCAGLAPLLFERSLQAQFLIPMAISLAFGVLFATIITLVIVPCFFVITNDIRRFFHWLRHGRWPHPTEVEPESQRIQETHHDFSSDSIEELPANA